MLKQAADDVGSNGTSTCGWKQKKCRGAGIGGASKDSCSPQTITANTGGSQAARMSNDPGPRSRSRWPGSGRVTVGPQTEPVLRSQRSQNYRESSRNGTNRRARRGGQQPEGTESSGCQDRILWRLRHARKGEPMVKREQVDHQAGDRFPTAAFSLQAATVG
jgi:hypothetical protein